MFPSIIFNSDNKIRIDENVFIDIKIRTFLEKHINKDEANNILDVLKYYSGKDNIKLRQEVFMSLKEKEINSFFQDFLSKVKSLKLKYDSINDFKVEFYKQIGYVFALKEYINLIEYVEKLKLETKSGYLNNLKKHFSNLYFSEKYNLCKSKIQKVFDMAQIIKNFDIMLEMAYYKVNSCKLSEYSFKRITNDFKKIAAGFNVDINEEKLNFYLDNNILNALKLKDSLFFKELDEFVFQYKDFIDISIFDYISQLRFYLSLNSIFNNILRNNIPLTLPEISEKEIIDIKNAYDITLYPNKIVPNDICISDDKKIIILTGANGGGKTTYIRTLMLCQILFLNGCFVPCDSAVMFPFCKIFTHFSKNETLIMSRFEEEKNRIDAILDKCDNKTLIILNETFSGTNEANSERLSLDLITEISKKEAGCIFVTHNYNIFCEASKNIKNIINLTAEVSALDNNTRTYKIVQRLSNQNSYSKDILIKYGLTRKQLEEKFLGDKNEIQFN